MANYKELQTELETLSEVAPEYRLFAHLVGYGKGIRDRLKDRGYRDFRYDFALPDHKLLIEIQGTGFSHSHRHNQHRDYQKNNDAVKEGWRVMYFPANVAKQYPHVIRDDVRKAIDTYELPR